MKKPKKLLFRWRDAFSQSSLSATTRAVLRAISEFMNEDGGSCFPSQGTISQASGLSEETVRKHIKIAEAAGWVVVGSAGKRGQKWRALSYLARIPASKTTGAAEAGKGECMTQDEAAKGAQPEAGKVPNAVGVYNTSPRISSNARAGVREDRGAVEAAFWRFLQAYPRPPATTPAKALRRWFLLTPEQRADCIAKTPAYLRTVKNKARLAGVETYLRERRWEAIATAQMKAPFRGPAWMACFLWRLLQPCVETFTFTGADEFMIANGKRTREQLVSEKRRKFGWPDASRMVALWRDKKAFFCPASVSELTECMVFVPVGTPLFSAWMRLAESRDWPLPEPLENGLYFPRVDDLAGDLDAHVQAALKAFETQAAGVFNAEK